MTVNKLADTPFHGRVAVVYPAGAEQSRTFTIRIGIDNKRGLLRPEMFAQGRIQVEQHADALLVPKDALLRDTTEGAREDQARIFTVEGGKAVEHQVLTGLESEDGQWVEVRGLSDGAQIVVAGQHGLAGGEQVTIGTGAAK